MTAVLSSVVLVALVTTTGTWLIARRSSSGRITNSTSTDLWAALRGEMERQQRRIETLERDRDALGERIAELEREIRGRH